MGIFSNIGGYDPYDQTPDYSGMVNGYMSRPAPEKEHKKFDWGNAALGFFGGSKIAAIIADRKDTEEKRTLAQNALEQARQTALSLGYSDSQARALAAHPESLARLVEESVKTRQGGAEGLTIDTVDPRTMQHHFATSPGWHGDNYYSGTDGGQAPGLITRGEKVFPVTQGGYLGVYGGPEGAAQQPQIPGSIFGRAGRALDNSGSAAPYMDSVGWVESRNRPGAIGPQTKWGRAHGEFQALDPTAREQALKHNMQWQPGMMTGTSPEAAAYQRQIGQGYLQEGMDKYHDPRKALMYYHGGPNERQWGPKTNAYADQVLARFQSAQGAPQAAPQMPQQAPQQQASNVPQSREAILAEASAAIQRGADPKQVAERLRQMGIQ